jgi:cytochrome c-type biogenesis protein CcmH/NrfF
MNLVNKLTTEDALNLVEQRAQWCRTNGESDMRSFIYMISSIRSMIAEGKSREEILEAYVAEKTVNLDS